MLTPEELATIAETMQPHLDELNMWISQDMIRRFMARMGRGEKDLLSGTDQWQAQVYKEAGGLYEDLQKELHKFTGKSEDEIKAIFEDAGIKAWNADDIFYVAQGFESVPLLSSERMLNILTDCYQRTNNEVYNFTRTTANETQRRFIKLLDSTHIKVMSGAQSYTAAVKEAVNELASMQTEVVYPSGHKDTIETAVLRAVRTGVAQASGNMTLQGMEERDWDLIRVSAHLGARYGDGGENPGNHYWWQGKLYSRTGRDKRYPDFIPSTGYGSGEGLCGWNCRHSYGPGDPDHNPYKEYDAEENKKTYDLSQKQRKIERTIRADKLKVKGLREAIDCAEDETLKKELSEDYEKASARLSMHNAEYNHFCESNGLKRYDDRLSIAKWNRSEAMKAVHAAKYYNATEALKNMRESGIIRTTGKYTKDFVIPQNLNFESAHLIERMKERNLSKEYIYDIINNPNVVLSTRRGKQYVFYSEKGFAAVNVDGKIQTAGHLDVGGNNVLEVAKKYGIYRKRHKAE
nr:MAG TPA: minor capsid protein [Caudoviricetes sp.]